MAFIRPHRSRSGQTTSLARVRLRGYPPETASFTRLRDARKWAQQVEAAMRERRHFPRREAKCHTVAHLVKRYRANVLHAPAKVRAGRICHLERWERELADLTRRPSPKCATSWPGRRSSATGSARSASSTTTWPL